jgi:hypothetical protein
MVARLPSHCLWNMRPTRGSATLKKPPGSNSRKAVSFVSPSMGSKAKRPWAGKGPDGKLMPYLLFGSY